MLLHLIIISRDFYIWTFAYDVSGIKNVTFYYRKDNDGVNPLNDITNEVYEFDLINVGAWIAQPMTHRAFPKVSEHKIFWYKE